MNKLLKLTTILLSLILTMSCTVPEEHDLSSIFELSLDSPDQGTVTNLNQATMVKIKILKYTGTTINSVSVYLDNNLTEPDSTITTSDSESDNYFTYAYTPQDTEEHTLSIIATGTNSGALLTSNTETITLKTNTPPTVKISTTDDKTLFFLKDSLSYTVHLDINDNDGTVADSNIVFTINGFEYEQNTSGDGFNYEVNSSEIPLGIYNFNVKITDNDGGTAEAELTTTHQLFDNDIILGDDFESYPAFTTTLSNWKVNNYNEGSKKGGFENITIPNSDINNSFFVLDPDSTSPGISNATAHSGNKYLACLYEAKKDDDGNPIANNDWLYSPKVTIEAGDILQFFAKSYSGNFLETIRVFAIKGESISPATTNPLHEDENILVPSHWKEYNFDLSEFSDEKDGIRFAINLTSLDKFAFFIDDIKIIDEDGRVKFSNNFEAINSYHNSSKVTTLRKSR